VKPRIDLRAVDERTLQAELRDRKRCVDCRAEHSSAWHRAGLSRVRCADCQQVKKVLEART